MSQFGFICRIDSQSHHEKGEKITIIALLCNKNLNKLSGNEQRKDK